MAPDRPNWGHAFCLPGHNNGPVITMILVKITVPFYDGDPNNDDEDLGL